MANEKSYIKKFLCWQEDWNRFVSDVMQARLDKEQQDIITSVQFNPLTAVASGTSRGKGFCRSMCRSMLYVPNT